MPSAIALALDHPLFAAALAFHILIGAIALAFYWVALTAIKGSRRHRVAGRRYFVAMLVVAFSVGPVLFATPGAFDPAFVVQFLYLVVCVVTAVTVAWTAIRWKDDLERFRGRHFRALGFVATFYAVGVLIIGIATGSVLTASFSIIGLVYGPAMLQFVHLRAPPLPRWWLGWHLNGVCGLFNAVHANVLAVTYEHLVDAGVGDAAILTTHLGTALVAVAMRIWLGRRYHVPLRFSEAHAPMAPAG